MRVTIDQNCKTLDDHHQRIEMLNVRVRVVEDGVVSQRVHNQWTKEALLRIEQKIDKQ